MIIKYRNNKLSHSKLSMIDCYNSIGILIEHDKVKIAESLPQI